MEKQSINVDVVIVGGGIAGLWILNRLKKHGYRTLLLEKEALGSGQTTKSQGIIHGGLKYALTGLLSDASQTIRNMPARWQKCLMGEGEIDLRSVEILSKAQYLWSTKNLASTLAGFFAAKTLTSRVQKLKASEYPTAFQHPNFQGTVYRLEEVILNTTSLIEALATPNIDALIKTDPKTPYNFHYQSNQPNQLSHLDCTSGEDPITLQAKSYIFAAGEGNEALTEQFTNRFPMQRRSLHMVLLKLPNAYPLFAHCMDIGLNPRITITTHPTEDGKTVWYLGGQLAEDGAHRTKAEQIKVAKQELQNLFPWVNFEEGLWETLFINRAEAKQTDGKRPNSFSIEQVGNAFAVWPTKLALSPLLADALLVRLQQDNIYPTPDNKTPDNLTHLEKPVVAKPIWELLF
jgi:glycerol-3-phosphate dehydrogenase